MIDISLEAGHIYAPEVYLNRDGSVANDGVHNGLKLGARIYEGLGVRGLSVQQILFVDDVNLRVRQHESAYSDAWRYILFIHRPIEQVKETVGRDLRVYSEYDFINRGKVLAERVKEKLGTGEDSVRLPDGEEVSLKGYSAEYPNLPSCAVLDLAVYLKRLKEAKETVTILPSTYRSQQRRVRGLAEVLEEPMRVSVAYFNRRGRVSSLEQWHTQDLTRESIVISEVVESLKN